MMLIISVNWPGQRVKRDCSGPVCSSYLTHQLCVDLGDAVDGARSLHTQVRGGVSG